MQRMPPPPKIPVIPDKGDRPAENVKGDAMNMCSQKPRELRTVFYMLHWVSELSSCYDTNVEDQK
jgi:hypothetical protein